MAVGQEIERKFLVVSEQWRDAVVAHVVYRQGYLCGNQRSSVRIRVSDQEARLNIKSATLGIERQEYDYPLPLEEAHTLLDCLCEQPLIEKTRYYVDYQGKRWEIDVFAGDNAGLIVAEIELACVDETIALPPWVGEEVSHDPRYYNVSLVKYPYKDWVHL